MKNSVWILAMAFGLLFSATVDAQALWQETSYGMSVDEVRSVVPTANTASTKPSRLGSGAEERLRVEDFDLVGKKFTILFYFLDGKLTQVTLSLVGNHSYNAAMLVFSALVDALRLKYGQELSSRTTKGSLSTTRNIWQSGRTNISLFAMAVGGTDATLNVSYQVRVAQDADKL